MSVTPMADPARETGGAQEFVSSLERIAGQDLAAVLLFGSQLIRSTPDRASAYDLVLVVEDYARFHRALVESGHHRRSVMVLNVLARVLAPNVISFLPSGPDGPVGKCMVLTRDDLARSLGDRSRDHFVKGRLVQKVAVLFTRDDQFASEVEAGLRQARRDVLRWVGPFLDPPFGAAAVAHRMLQVSYRGEIRPESKDRVDEVFTAQRAFLERAFGEVLEEEARRGVLTREGKGWRFTSPPGRWQGRRIRLYFLRSKARATARWLKYVVTFDDWLAYIQRKVERRTGLAVEITPRERRYPLIFLWPKLVRVLRARPERGLAEGRPMEGSGGPPDVTRESTADQVPE